MNGFNFLFKVIFFLVFQNDGSESEMALAMNRYMGNSVLPLLIAHARFYSESDNYASLLDATLHTVYRLSKNRMLTKGQRESVSDFLVALTRYWINYTSYKKINNLIFSQMQPSMLLKLLRKLTVDVSNLSEYTTVALRVMSPFLLFLKLILRILYSSF